MFPNRFFSLVANGKMWAAAGLLVPEKRQVFLSRSLAYTSCQYIAYLVVHVVIAAVISALALVATAALLCTFSGGVGMPGSFRFPEGGAVGAGDGGAAGRDLGMSVKS